MAEFTQITIILNFFNLLLKINIYFSIQRYFKPCILYKHIYCILCFYITTVMHVSIF